MAWPGEGLVSLYLACPNGKWQLQTPRPSGPPAHLPPPPVTRRWPAYFVGKQQLCLMLVWPVQYESPHVTLESEGQDQG